MNADTITWSEAVFGPDQDIQAPGHPVVLACMVMDRYPNLARAQYQPPDKQYLSALRDTFIPGSGCAVHAALSVLDKARRFGLEWAYDYAETYWANYESQESATPEKGARGRAQFAQVKERFERQLAVWGTEKDPGSPYRVAE